MSTATIETPVARTEPRSVAGGRERLRDVLVIALPCALAAALVLYELATRSLWLDESASVAISAQHGAALWSAIARDGGNMLGYYLLLHAVTGLFGHAPAVIRAPSALATVGTVAIVCLIGRRLLHRRAALAAGLLTAVSLPLVFWGQDARSYALMVMFIAGSFLAFIELVDGTGSTWVWLAYAASSVLAIYMSFVAALVIPAQLLSLLWRRDRVRAVGSALALIAACSVPIAVLAVHRGSSQLFWVPPPSLKRIGEMARWLTSSGMPPNFHRTATGTVLLVLSLAVLAAALVAVVRVRGERSERWAVVLIASWLVIPIVLFLAESFAGQPVALARSSIVALPAVALLIAWALTRPRIPGWLGLAVLAVLLALRALQLGPSYGTSPENWKGATQYVLARSQASDCVAFYPADGRMAFDYYLPSATRLTPVLPAVPWAQIRPYVERYAAPAASQLMRIEAGCPRLWLIASHQGQRDGPPASRVNYARYLTLLHSLAGAYPRHETKAFGWASPVRVELLTR